MSCQKQIRRGGKSAVALREGGQIKKALIKAFQKLKDKSPSANLDAEILLIETLLQGQSLKLKKSKQPKQRTVLKAKSVEKINRTWLYTNLDYELSKPEIKKYFLLVDRRLRGEPIAYIIGHKEFFGLDFFVNRQVLIPRPETEILVEKAIKYTCPESLDFARDKYSRGVGNRSLAIADIGTGSGCIAVSIAKNSPQSKITASDISRRALSITQKNAEKHKVLSKIKFQIGDDYGKNKFDVILVNLPYLTPNQIKKDLKYEPRKALLGGTDGLDIYRTVLPKIKNNLAKKYLIIFECAPSQISKLKKIAKANINDPHFKTIKDLSNKNRFLEITPSQPK